MRRSRTGAVDQSQIRRPPRVGATALNYSVYDWSIFIQSLFFMRDQLFLTPGDYTWARQLGYSTK
jgi:hypothetical protein